MCLYTFGATEAYQLLKLPILVQHFFQHKQEDKHLSFWAFLNMHYAEKTVIDADYQQDMQLPFKTNDADICMSASISFPAPFFIFETISAPTVQQIFPTTNEQMYVYLNQTDIFQPPKFFS